MQTRVPSPSWVGGFRRAVVAWVSVLSLVRRAAAAAGPGSLDEGFRPELPVDGTWVSTITVDGKGRVWAGLGASVVRLLPDGRKDPDFVVTELANDAIRAIAVGADGTAYVGGEFTEYGGERHPGVVRLLENGRWDRTFRPVPPARGRQVAALAVHPGGGVVVGGWFDEWDGAAVPEFVRVFADGALDREFLSRLPAANPSARTSIARIESLPDGRFMVGGSAIWRLAIDGRVEATITFDGSYRTWAAAADGGVWIVMQDGTEDGEPAVRLRRFRPDGTPDPGWDRTYACDRWVSEIAPANDGGLILAGDFDVFAGGRHRGLVRLRADGSVDYGFVSELGLREGNGWIESEAIAAWQVVAAPGEGWYVRGAFTNIGSASVPGLARVRGGERIAGPPAIRESLSGRTFTEGMTASLGFLVESALPITAGWTRDGAAIPGAQEPALRLDDLRFADAGVYRLHVTNAAGAATSGALDVRVNWAPTHPGSVDVTFAPMRSLSSEVPYFAPPRLWGAALDTDGRSVLAWASLWEFSGVVGHRTTNLVRFLPDGEVDKGFVAMRGERPVRTVRQVLPMGNGRVLMEGRFDSRPTAGISVEQLVMLKPDGSRDEGFRLEVERISSFASITALLRAGADRILAAGSFKSPDPAVPWRVVRLTSDGSLDKEFRPIVLAPAVSGLAFQSTGRLLVRAAKSTGGTEAVPQISRYLADGTPDPSFRVGAEIDRAPTSWAIDSRDRILVGMDTLATDSGPRKIVVRLLPDGELDATFTPWIEDRPNYLASAQNIALQADGRILVHRDYQMRLDGAAYESLWRLEPDGRPDPTFATADAYAGIRSVLVTTDDQIVIAGIFRGLDAAARAGLARLNGHDERRVVARRRAGPGGAATWDSGIWTRRGRRYVVERADQVAGASWSIWATIEGSGSWEPFEAPSGNDGFLRARIEDTRTR